MTTINAFLTPYYKPNRFIENSLLPKEVVQHTDFSIAEKMFLEWYKEHGGEFVTTQGSSANETDNTDEPAMVGTIGINLYIGGVTSELTTVIRCCVRNGISLTLMQFNCVTGEYEAQPMC